MKRLHLMMAFWGGMVSLCLLLPLSEQRAIRKSEMVADWPVVRGVVLSSRLSRGDSPLVFYRYEVDGRVFENNRIWLYGPSKWARGLSKWEAERIVQAYHPGEYVIVYHDPKDPSRSALKPGSRFSSQDRLRDSRKESLSAAAWFGGIGLFLLLVYKRELAKPLGLLGAISLVLFVAFWLYLFAWMVFF